MSGRAHSWIRPGPASVHERCDDFQPPRSRTIDLSVAVEEHSQGRTATSDPRE